MDLGTIGDRTFMNTPSFSAYAEVVKSPVYRDDRRDTAPRFARHARPDALVCLVRPKVPSGVPDRL